MKKILSLIVLITFVFMVTSCDSSTVDINNTDTETNSAIDTTITQGNQLSVEENEFDKETTDTPEYKIGDEVVLGDIKFNIYKIESDNKTLHLLAQKNIATTTFSDGERPYDEEHNYDGSLVEGFVNKFVDGLEDKGYCVKSSCIIDKNDLIELGFDVDGLNGTKYKISSAPEFIKSEKHFWVDGYCRYDTYAWVYFNGVLTTEKCEGEYGVRPVIVVDSIEPSEKPQATPLNLNIKEVVNSESAWTSEGGIHNPYDKFYFDCEKMIFTNIFKSSEFERTDEFDMEFIDDKTIQIDGLRNGYDYPAQITVVSATKLRVRFLDEDYNDGDYYLNKCS